MMPRKTRFFALVLLVPALCLSQQAPPVTGDVTSKPARLEGRVTSLNGEAVRKATVRLQGSAQLATGGNAQGRSNYSVTTGDGGEFVFENVTAGRYTLTAEKSGFLPMRYGARSENGPPSQLTVAAGTEIARVEMKMTPQGVIIGRVLDSDGDPIANAQITASRYGYDNGRRTLMEVGTGIQATALPAGAGAAANPAAGAAALTSLFGGGGLSSDDQGNFRINNLPPGRYYVKAEFRGTAGILGMIQAQAVAFGGEPAAPAQESTHIATFYPNSMDASGAVPVEVTAGSEVRGVDIRMRKERVYSIRGKVIDTSTGGPVNGAMVLLIPPDVSEVNPFALLSNMSLSGTDGTFEIRNLLPGNYGLQGLMVPGMAGLAAGGRGAVAPAAGAPGGNILAGALEAKATSRVDASVRASDVTGAVLELAGGKELPGTVRMDEGNLKDYFTAPPQQQNQNAALAQIQNLTFRRIQLRMSEGVNLIAPNGQFGDDGAFKITGVFPAKYFVNISGLPQTLYVKSIRFGGQDATRAPLDLTSGAIAPLEIVLSAKAAEFAGIVRDDNGQPIQGVPVTLWPKVRDQARQDGGIKTAYSDQNGGFTITGLAPGDYFAAAWEDLPESGLNQNPDFLARFADGAAIKLEAGAHQSGDTRLVGTEKILVEAAKLP